MAFISSVKRVASGSSPGAEPEGKRYYGSSPN